MTQKTKYIVIFSLLLYSATINAQKIQGKVVTADNQTPISFAKIGIVNQNHGVIADKDGKFVFDFTLIDKNSDFFIQHNGYEPYVQKVSNFLSSKQHVISLTRKTVELDEVLITQKKLVDKTLGVKSKSKAIQVFLNGNENQVELGILIKNKKRVKIQSINLNLAKFQIEKPLLVKFYIYSLKNGFPNESLVDYELTTNISSESIKNNVFSFDVSDKNIWIDKESFFVSIVAVDFGKNSNYISLSGSLMKSSYIRASKVSWEKISVGAPAINIDVKIEK